VQSVQYSQVRHAASGPKSALTGVRNSSPIATTPIAAAMMIMVSLRIEFLIVLSPFEDSPTVNIRLAKKVLQRLLG